jgi:hypothetical protein
MGIGNELWDQFAGFFTKPDYDSFAALCSPDAVYIEPSGVVMRATQRSGSGSTRLRTCCRISTLKRPA